MSEFPPGEQIPTADLQRTLAAAGRDLEERSGIGSASSEERDNVEPALRIHQELERQTNGSSVSSEGSRGTLNSVRARYRGRAGERALPEAAGLATDYKSYVDRADLGIASTFRQEQTPASLARQLEQGGASSSSSKPSVGARFRDHPRPGSAADSNKGSTGGSITGSGSGAQSHGGTGVGSGASSGAGTGTASRNSKVNASAIYETLNNEQKDMVDSIISDLSAKHGSEVASAQMLLVDASIGRDVKEENTELQAKLTMMHQRLLQQESLQERLQRERAEKLRKEEEKDELKDRMAGLEARARAKAERHEEEIQAKKAEVLAVKSREEKEKAELSAKAAAAEEESMAIKKKEILAEEKVALVKREEADEQWAQQARLAAMRSLLEATEEDVARQAEASSGLEALETVREARCLESLLGEKIESNRLLKQEMASLRLEMLRLEQDKYAAGAMASASSFVSRERDARSKLQGKARSGRFMKPSTKGPSSKAASGLLLSSIDEEDDDDAISQAVSACSGQVSSDGAACGIGDLHDFDDYSEPVDERENAEKAKKIDALLQEIEEYEKANKQLKDEVVDKDAQHMSKVNRLLEKVDNEREERLISESELEAVQATKEMIQMEKEVQLARMRQKLEETKDVEDKLWQKVEEKENEHAADLEEMRQQLFYAMEARRLEGIRLEDTRRELAACEERHARVVRELNAKLKLAYSSNKEEGSLDEDDQELEKDLMEQLRQAEQERNLLKNEKESLKVYWQGLLEHEQLQHAADLQRLEKLEEALQRERENKKRLEESFAESERQLDEAVRAKDKAEAAVKSEIEKAAEAKLAEERTQSMFGFLRCPSRSAPVSAAAFSKGLDSEDSVPSLQLAMWQMMSAMRGVTALLCHSEGLRIVDATKKACTLWGSAVLRGSTLASLVFDDLTASWLRREITVPGVADRSNGGYSLRSIGCVEFRNKLGSAFDSSVICARLPHETSLGKEAVVIVVVEPMEEEEFHGRGHPKKTSVASSQQWPQRGSFRPGPPSGVPSIASEDITANDSVSNILVNH